MNALIDITGQRFGRLVVSGRAPTRKNVTYWHCNCDCGNNSIVASSHLLTSTIKSCGCFRATLKLKHGHNKKGKTTKIYWIWQGMKARCSDLKQENYRYYGARGITVCERWINSFENFLTDMGERPKGLTLERKDNDKGYSPDNCIWTSPREQRMNQRPRTYKEKQ